MNSRAVTVVLATFNGGERLRETLSSMEQLRTLEFGWKLIVVDNGSTDQTPSIIEEYKDKLPLTTLFCATRGKNTALNTAIPYFEGDLIVFTDDDVLVPANWLVEFLALARNNPEYSVFGGRIVPHWPYTPKEEIINGVSCGEAFAIHEANISDGPIDCSTIWGPNMAVRASIFHAGFKYNESIGPTKGNYIPGSETTFNTMLEKHGFKFYFSNQIVVKHHIRPEQLTTKWLMKRAYRFGKGRVVWNHLEGKDDGAKKIGIFPRWYASYFLKAHAEYVLSWIFTKKTMRMKAIWNAMIAYGMIVQTIRIYKSAQSVKS